MTTRPLQNLSKNFHIPKHTPIATPTAPTHTLSNLKVNAHPCPFTRRFQWYEPTLLKIYFCVHPSPEEVWVLWLHSHLCCSYHLLIHPAVGAGPQRWHPRRDLCLLSSVLSPLPGEAVPSGPIVLEMPGAPSWYQTRFSLLFSPC